MSRLKLSLLPNISLPKSSLSLVAIAIVGSSVGCAAVFKNGPGPSQIDLKSAELAGYAVGPNGVQSTIPVASDKPSIVLEVLHKGRHLEQIPLQEGKPTFIGDIVKDANLIDRIGRINITILRPSPDGNPPLSLQVDLNTTGEQVEETQNYSLRPGDHVQISKQKRSILGEMIGPMAILQKRG